MLGPHRDGGIRALTGNFIEVRLPASAPVERGEPVDVLIGHSTPDATTAEAAGRPAWAGAGAAVV